MTKRGFGIMLGVLAALIILVMIGSVARADEPLRPAPLIDETDVDAVRWQEYEAKRAWFDRVGKRMVLHGRREGVVTRTVGGRLQGTIAPPSIYTNAACDSKQECEKKVDELCESAGHGGRKDSEITDHGNGESTCSGHCKDNGAVAFVTCNPA